MIARALQHAGNVRRSPRSRSGLATLELVLVFPFLLALLMVTFTVASKALSQMAANRDARRQAWSGRHAAWRAVGRHLVDQGGYESATISTHLEPRWPGPPGVHNR